MAAELVGGAFLSSFLNVLFDRLSDPEIINMMRGKKVDQKLLQKLETMLNVVEAVLNDAEKKQITDLAVKRWLENLQDAVYDADDLLDEVATKAATQKDPPGFMDKRYWSNEETEAFVSFMEEFVVDATRPDCGQFKNSTFEKLALKMIQAFPNCTLTTKHCRNKHKRMKEKYQYAADMLACSGFGWNDERQCVEVDSREVLEAWVKAHPKKYYTPGKPFPMFQRLGRIFGKDRATGSAAVSGNDAEENVDEDADEEEADMEDVFMSGTPTTDAPSRSHGNAGQGTATSAEPSGIRKTLSGKKRKQMDILERMADEVHDSTAAQKEHVQILANAISGKNNDVKMGEKLEQLGFADHEAIRIVVKINSKPELEKSFWGFTDAQLTTLAHDILDGNMNYY